MDQSNSPEFCESFCSLALLTTTCIETHSLTLRHDKGLSGLDSKNGVNVFKGIHVRIRTRFADHQVLWCGHHAASGGEHGGGKRSLHGRVLDPSLLFLLFFVLLDLFAVLD